ncbi:MAG: acyl-CoA dehydrogenase family protein [Deltaproteobacteria bacterium]|nr:acyl-CoA dehydrogenase family protein [Deltaproteobacteria bacterium]
MEKRKLFGGGEFLITEVAPEHIFVPEEMTQEHQMIYDAAMDFVKKEIQPNLDRIEEKDEAYARSLFRTAGELGLNGTDVPEAYGGEGMDKISTCLVTEAVATAAGASFAVAHGAHTGIGTLPIVYFGNEDQKKRYLSKLAAGEWIAAYCLTEPNAGSDALNAQTTAVLSEDGTHYLLNGEKIYITNGAWADLFIVYAKVDGEKFTGFIVERTFPGVSHGPEEKKMGIKGSSTTPIIFKDCQVPVENVLFEVGQGHKIAFNVLNIGRYKLGASVVGGCKLAVTEAAKYATLREQFGKKICSFGMIKNKLADMSIKTYIAESMVYRMAAALDDILSARTEEEVQDPAANARTIEEYAVECSIAKIFGSETLDFCADELVQIYGGNGYTAEYPVERMYRDARINRIFEGTNEINRLLIVATLFRRAMKGRLALLEAVEQVQEMLNRGAPEPQKTPDSGPLALQDHYLKAGKKIFLLAAGIAANQLMMALEQEQEVVALLADMVMEIYAMESGLLRAQKVLKKKGGTTADYHAAAVKVYINDTLPGILNRAKQVVAFVEKKDQLPRLYGAIDTLAGYQPMDTIPLRRFIADKVIKGKKYPF